MTLGGVVTTFFLAGFAVVHLLIASALLAGAAAVYRRRLVAASHTIAPAALIALPWLVLAPLAALDLWFGGLLALVLMLLGVPLSLWIASRFPRRQVEVVGPAPSSAAATGTNGFAVASLVLGLLGISVIAIVFGGIGLAQVNRTGESGRGMAIAGLVLGVLWLVAIGVLVAVAAAG